MNIYQLKLAQERKDSLSNSEHPCPNIHCEPIEPFDKALQACLSCRSQKRRCDKVLPTCSLCARVRRACNYSFEPSSSSRSEEFLSHQRKVRHHEAQREGQSTYGSPISSTSWRSSSKTPSRSLNGMEDTERKNQVSLSVFFLDGAAFNLRGYQFSHPHLPLPEIFEEVCPTHPIILRIVSSYFATTHLWLPIVSRDSVHVDLNIPVEGTTADLGLLYLCMRLVGERLPSALQNPQTAFYVAVREYHFLVESAGILSLHLLQAGILLAIYEFGHAIFPNAYVTIGRCAKIGYAMGIHHGASAPPLLGPPASWTEMEERSRVWWAVYLLDRLSNLGNPALPFSVQDPNQEDYLPCREIGWSNGDLGLHEPLFFSSPTSVPAGRYARLCQTSHLLGRITQHLNNKFLDDDSRLQEVIQLNRSLQELYAVISAELSEEQSSMALHSAIALCYSGMMILNKPYSGIEPVGISASLVIPAEFRNHALATLRLAARETSNFVATLYGYFTGLTDQLSPLIAQCLYQAISTYACLNREAPRNLDILSAIEFLKDALRKLERRWKIAGLNIPLPPRKSREARTETEKNVLLGEYIKISEMKDQRYSSSG